MASKTSNVLRAVAAGVALAALAPSAPAQVVLDGWGSAGSVGNPPPVYSQSTTTGVTVGAGALKTLNPQGGFWGPSTGNLATEGFFNALRDAARITFDVTLNSTELSGDGSNFTGFAQTNELSIQLFSNAGGTLPNGINVFSQRAWASPGDTDSKNHNATWSGDNGTRTITFDLTTFTGTDATDNQTKTISQMMTQHPDISFVKINFVQQIGGGVAPGAFYWDNVRLLNASGGTLALIGNFEPVPEPTSLAFAGLAVPALVFAARRRRARRAVIGGV
jgi:hypothetical protein